MSNRVALAPITDSRLNTSSGTPLKKRIGPIVSGKPGLGYSKSFSVRHSADTNGKKKSLSFSDYKTAPHSSHYSSNKAGLAATKLRVKLQLALFKLQQTRGLAVGRTIDISGASKTCVGKKDTLASIASQKSQLRLFQVKKKSAFWTSGHDIPLASRLPTVEDKPSLPPINKILKTPMKSSRSLVEDTTIDEDGDATIVRREGLSSSPIQSFGTPNSFSVAKSLLELGQCRTNDEQMY